MHDRTEWEMDRLTELVGRRVTADLDAPAWREGRFADWMARASRERAPNADRWDAARVAECARSARMRALIERLGVRRVHGAPEERPALASAPAHHAVDEAALAGCGAYLDLAAAAGAGRELWDSECESWVELPDDVPRGRYVALRVAGDSMAPLMHAGDVVLVRLGTRVVSDSVIVARRPDDGYVVKRVGKIRRGTIELLSLHPDYPPIDVPRDEQLIVGTVLLRWCAHEPAHAGDQRALEPPVAEDTAG